MDRDTDTLPVSSSTSSHNTSMTSDTTLSSHDESQISKASKKQKILAKMSIRRDKMKQKVLQKRQENLLSMADFFNKQEEFKLWMYEQKNKNVNSLTSADQKAHFKKFIKLWNKRKLAQKYLHGPQTPPSTRRNNRFSLIDTTPVHTPDLLDFREPVDLSLPCTPATPMSTFGKSWGHRDDDASTPKRSVLSEVNFTPLTDKTSKGGLHALRKSMFDSMAITSPIHKYTTQVQQNREAAVISEGQTRWKDLQLEGRGNELEDAVSEARAASEAGSGSMVLEDFDGSPYSMMRHETRDRAKPKLDDERINKVMVMCEDKCEVLGVVRPGLIELELLDQSHSPYSRMRAASVEVSGSVGPDVGVAGVVGSVGGEKVEELLHASGNESVVNVGTPVYSNQRALKRKLEGVLDGAGMQYTGTIDMSVDLDRSAGEMHPDVRHTENGLSDSESGVRDSENGVGDSDDDAGRVKSTVSTSESDVSDSENGAGRCEKGLGQSEGDTLLLESDTQQSIEEKVTRQIDLMANEHDKITKNRDMTGREEATRGDIQIRSDLKRETLDKNDSMDGACHHGETTEDGSEGDCVDDEDKCYSTVHATNSNLHDETELSVGTTRTADWSRSEPEWTVDISSPTYI